MSVMQSENSSVKVLSRSEILKLFDQPLIDLLMQAQSIHRQYHQPNQVQKSSLLSIKTGGCPEDCSYCPQSSKYQTNTDASGLMP